LPAPAPALRGARGPDPASPVARRLSPVACFFLFLAAVAEAGGDAVDGEVDGAAELVSVAFAGAEAPQQVDLQVAERIDVGDAVAQAERQRRVGLEQRLRLGDGEERRARVVVLAFDPS